MSDDIYASESGAESESHDADLNDISFNPLIVPEGSSPEPSLGHEQNTSNVDPDQYRAWTVVESRLLQGLAAEESQDLALHLYCSEILRLNNLSSRPRNSVPRVKSQAALGKRSRMCFYSSKYYLKPLSTQPTLPVPREYAILVLTLEANLDNRWISLCSTRRGCLGARSPLGSPARLDSLAY